MQKRQGFFVHQVNSGEIFCSPVATDKREAKQAKKQYPVFDFHGCLPENPAGERYNLKVMQKRTTV